MSDSTTAGATTGGVITGDCVCVVVGTTWATDWDWLVEGLSVMVVKNDDA